jgi:LacI family transcriptional regulator
VNNTTLKQIANTLGCSISTVSRALKHHPDISVKTREKVLELANTLDYEPNAFAVHLRTQNSKVIGLMVPAIFNYFYESFISSVEEECRKNGYALMILQTANDPATEAKNLKIFRQNRVTGLFACISAKTKTLEDYDKLTDQNIPVVFFDIVPEEKSLHKVCMADEKAATLAAEALHAANKKNIIGVFGDPLMSITQKRLAAFENYVQSKNAKLTIIHSNNSNDAEEAVSELLNSSLKVDAIFCMSDELLIGAMKAIQMKELMLKSDIGLIAISNGFVPKLYYPQVTYVETSGHQLGKLAFTQLMACLSGSTAVNELIVESVLIQGGSL